MSVVSVGPLDVLTVPEVMQLRYEIMGCAQQAAQVWRSMLAGNASYTLIRSHRDMAREFETLATSLTHRLWYMQSMQYRS